MAGEQTRRLMYRNPIINADWPDPDAIRVGEMYYLVASSFNRAPGLPILRSPNLLDWEPIGRALPAVPPDAHFELPRHGGGVWAPSIRHHDGLFWIFYPDPDRGVLVLTAEDPAGPWSEPHVLLPGLGVIDPCPLWDDDGRAWMVFGWAKSRSGVNNRLSVVQISPDARRTLSAPTTVIDGDLLPGYFTLEGPKFYQRDGWYWIFAPAGGVSTGWQSVFRSRHVLGPYEDRIVLQQAGTPVNGPHQGAWITSPEGEDWFLHFQDRGVFGRVTHLQPMRWDEEGWPVIGADGRPVLEHPAPARALTAPSGPASNDDFSDTTLGPQWYWQANPRPGWLRLDGDGFAGLRALPNDLGTLRSLPQVLGRQLPGAAVEFTTTLRLEATELGTRAGAVILGTDYAYVGLVRDAGGIRVETRSFTPGTGETVRFGTPLRDPSATVALRILSSDEGVCTLQFRVGPRGSWVTGLDGFQATQGHWVSAELGLFATAPPGSSGDGTAIFGPVALRAQDGALPVLPRTSMRGRKVRS
ncbi:family 43 glycosylhydrolase [Nonomuraea sp. NPDC005650]|uniref:glycoside hydrolase family 43 protein n=1 Tax=Nonomuraea sp. NPDC005650 TaxID=3157045 RepID=UPI0033BF8E48